MQVGLIGCNRFAALELKNVEQASVTTVTSLIDNVDLLRKANRVRRTITEYEVNRTWVSRTKTDVDAVTSTTVDRYVRAKIVVGKESTGVLASECPCT